jgi:hypothetical protein
VIPHFTAKEAQPSPEATWIVEQVVRGARARARAELVELMLVLVPFIFVRVVFVFVALVFIYNGVRSGTSAVTFWTMSG